MSCVQFSWTRAYDMVLCPGLQDLSQLRYKRPKNINYYYCWSVLFKSMCVCVGVCVKKTERISEMDLDHQALYKCQLIFAEVIWLRLYVVT